MYQSHLLNCANQTALTDNLTGWDDFITEWNSKLPGLVHDFTETHPGAYAEIFSAHDVFIKVIDNAQSLDSMVTLRYVRLANVYGVLGCILHSRSTECSEEKLRCFWRVTNQGMHCGLRGKLINLIDHNVYKNLGTPRNREILSI